VLLILGMNLFVRGARSAPLTNKFIPKISNTVFCKVGTANLTKNQAGCLTVSL